MATDLKTRKAPFKSDDFLRRKFADLCTRIARVDLIAHLLVLVLVTAVYAFMFGTFDWFAGTSSAATIVAIRWLAYGVFLTVLAALIIKTAFAVFRRVNPYYVAHQLEQTLPDAKNELINWLDLNEEELPAAFQKNLGARAAEQWREGDAGRIVRTRKNWVLLGVLAAPLAGLMVLLVLDPSGFFASMRRAFIPFYAPAPMSRTLLTLVQPESGDLDVNATHPLTFAVNIEGRVPPANRADAATLLWRYQENDDYLTLPLAQGDGNLWTACLDASKLRAGLTYKITAGDAETPEHRITVRPRAHVVKFEVSYRHRPFRKLQPMKSVFPNDSASKPHIHGPLGTDVEIVMHASRPVKNARVEFVANKVKKELPVALFKEQTTRLACRFTLEQSGQFRVLYTAADGEENVDREFYPIDAMPDAFPRVVLTRPGKDMEIPFNSSFILEGKAESYLGIRALNLQIRAIDGPDKGAAFAPIPYRPDKTLPSASGAFPGAVEYMEFVALNLLKDEQGLPRQPQPGGVLEYWLEAADGTDFPSPNGNIGKSAVYKLKLLDAPVDPKQEAIHRKTAADKIQQHQKKQDEQKAKDNQKKPGDKGQDKDKKEGGGGGAGGSGANPQPQLDKIQNENQDTKQKLNDAMNESKPDRGDAKGSDPKSGEAKGGQGDGDSHEPKNKQGEPMTPNDAGGPKNPGGKGAGQSRDNGTPMPKPGTKNDAPPPQGNAKGSEQNGPQTPTPDQQSAKNEAGPPDLQPKAGGMNEPGAAKSGPGEGAGGAGKGPGQARGEDKKADAKEPSFDRLDKNLQKLDEKGPDADAAAKDLADIAEKATDPRKRELAKEMLHKNGRDPKTGKKVPSPIGTLGKSPGIGDDIRKEAAKREFAARIGQMQLDDWQKRVTPEMLKKAGISPTEWERFVKNTSDYNALVRAWNAQIARQALKALDGPRTATGSGLNTVDRAGVSTDTPATIARPPELRDAVQQFLEPNAPAKKSGARK